MIGRTELGERAAEWTLRPEVVEKDFWVCWTLDRLTAYLHERPTEAGGPLPISRSQIDRLLHGEGLRWRTQERWFGERVDPDFAEKRGALRRSGRRRRPRAWWSTSTRWGQKAPRAIRG